MLKSKNIFVCIGAIHHDYLLNLKKNIINFRSNQITQKSRIGGVAYNIAELLSNFVDVNFYSLAINEEIRKKISKKIYVNQVNKDYADRYYLALSDKNNKFLLGLCLWIFFLLSSVKNILITLRFGFFKAPTTACLPAIKKDDF